MSKKPSCSECRKKAQEKEKEKIKSSCMFTAQLKSKGNVKEAQGNWKKPFLCGIAVQQNNCLKIIIRI